MILWTRVSLASFFAAAALAATGLAWHASSKTCPVPSHAEPQVLPAADQPTPEAVAAGDDNAADMTGDTDAVDPSPEGYIAGAGELDIGWIPRSYMHAVTLDQTGELSMLVNDWLSGDEAPRIEYRRGVVRVHSDEDRGDEPPYPRSATASGERVCGEPATWMRDAIRERLHFLAPGDITCSGNVCSYGGSEYAPTGYLIFHPGTYQGEPTWALDAWIEVYEAALPAHTVAQNQADVVRLMKRVASSTCAGEPEGSY